MAPSIVRDLELPSHPIPESLQTPSAATPVPALFSLAGKTIAITGGGRGLGLTMALAVVEAGGSVACLDVLPSPGPDWARLEKTASTNKASASYRICDVIDDAALGASIDEIAAEAGARGEPLWGCIACAGIQQQTPALQYPAADFDRMMRVNVTGVFNTCRHTARILQEARRPGSIVMIASISGNIANRVSRGKSSRNEREADEMRRASHARRTTRARPLCSRCAAPWRRNGANTAFASIRSPLV